MPVFAKRRTVRPKIIRTESGGKERLSLWIIESAEPEIIDRFLENNQALMDALRQAVEDYWQ